MKCKSIAKAKEKKSATLSFIKLINHNKIKQSLTFFISNSQNIIDPLNVLYQVSHDTVTLYYLSKSKKVVIHPDANIGNVALRFKLFLVIMGGILLTDGNIDPCDIININIVTLRSSNNFCNMSHLRICFGALNICNKYIFTAGGRIDQSQCCTTEIFDAIKNKWSDMPHLKKERQICGAIYCFNKIYVIGGISGKDLMPSLSFEECCLSGSAWKLKEISIYNVIDVFPVYDCNEYAIFGGYSLSNKVVSLYKLNLHTNSIETIKEFSSKRKVESCGNINNHFVFIAQDDAISVSLTHPLKITPYTRYFCTFQVVE